MSSNPTPRHFRAQTSSVIAITVCFIAVALVLTGLVAHVVATMTRSANEIDDARADRAARAAIISFMAKLSGTMKDNAVWDDAYAAIGSAAAADWAFENWGKTSADYSLYDGAVVIGPDGNAVSAYLKGKPFQPRDYFGAGFDRQIEAAATPQPAPLLNFFKTEAGILLVASQAIQPFEAKGELPKLSVLTFFKELTPEVIDALSDEHELDGLRLQATPEPNQLNSPIKDMGGTVIGYLVWPSKAPGDAIFDKVYPYVTAAASILALFLAAVLLAGASEAGRLRRLAEAARFEAGHDSLSGLLNRHGLLGMLDQLDNTSLPASLYMIDLDGFKAVNDAWGHAVGDELIRIVAKALQGCHPEIHDSARLGGDEFALVQVGSAPHRDIEESILKLFRNPFKIGGRTIEVGTSIGVACRIGNIAPLELLRRADIALYRAKENGKGQAVTYDLELDRERQRIAELEGELRNAINSGAIEPVFQPLVSASTGAIIGLEALARWRSAAGSISPEVFIPLAEKSGLIDALGVHMLRTSIQHAKAWPYLALSVNVSPIQLCNPDFAAQVTAVLDESAFDPTRLTLEITEGVLMTNPDQARRSIDVLRRIGIKFALDDFGCGYASIGALRQFGFDRMKIDRSLVLGLEENANGIDILRATVALATALEIPVTAEGIENLRQAEILRASGCDQLQGYLVGKPMSAGEIGEKLRQRNSAA
ncbi:bifunctional diguanylate cyclase/phosphodiesterase (plasmid) [Rhizobium sp. CB3171]|uniref:bifunctional diguanylate cyclase/phosphodiesterase n=1 Tax=Rhizobium sp. CB3171 TaxID=3039157 RepID=UPI0024B0ED55|nr:bifunctional diguanylate cyclase/phosphodiesterase [Rhizobium sp. CB3171]WFU05791.1 bifunctional diguanylate cyclase/phosphodiesterase [Rhizobium sp. CB3171]